MPVAIRIIPQLLCRNRQLVKGKNYNSWRGVGFAAQAVRIHQMRSVDELILLDIGATPENRGPDLSMIRELSDVCFSPLAVGGGVKSNQDVRDLLNAGADKIVIGTAAALDTGFVIEACERFGSSTFTASIDVRNHAITYNCGKDTFNVKPEFYALMLQELGVGELLVSSVDREGTMDGYDLDLIGRISKLVKIPVIASGGCSGYEDMEKAIDAGADAVSAGALFQFTDCTPRGAAEYLNDKGYEVRIP